MIKNLFKSMVIVIGVIIAFIVGRLLMVVFANLPQYIESRAKVFKYVEENYTDIKYRPSMFSVIGIRVVTGRKPDMFFFIDETNNKRFRVYCDNGRIVDDYAFGFVKEEIENKAKELFPNNDLDYSVGGMGLRSVLEDEPYGRMYCWLHVIEKGENDLSKIYRLISLINKEFIGMNLRIGFKPILKNRKDLDSYGYYSKDFKLTGGTFMSEEEFLKFMAEETPKE